MKNKVMILCIYGWLRAGIHYTGVCADFAETEIVNTKKVP